ncbi:MAG: hypothetical protein GY774_39720 [Planctomycetes bacterium]|nr:hypothetical protein [Planctomycetota bacterium]
MKKYAAKGYEKTNPIQTNKRKELSLLAFFRIYPACIAELLTESLPCAREGSKKVRQFLGFTSYGENSLWPQIWLPKR